MPFESRFMCRGALDTEEQCSVVRPQPPRKISRARSSTRGSRAAARGCVRARSIEARVRRPSRRLPRSPEFRTSRRLGSDVLAGAGGANDRRGARRLFRPLPNPPALTLAPGTPAEGDFNFRFWTRNFGNAGTAARGGPSNGRCRRGASR